ncbi:hypothetical protein [Azonexus sp.]|jgi:hypothetical protein|uniref:hypothetical protein n=1 Tax=Azonexus sp. TaxID=1872668 RepID=UPI002836873A|nr:hypothetical protein [Azonexus sp.]MDR1994785.1 hypothetical protein [Azonexus sp.]
MTEIDLQPLLARGEDRHRQFKRDEANADSIAVKLTVFVNSVDGWPCVVIRHG